MFVIEIRVTYWEATTRESGPNDIWRVVWAPGEFFFHYSCLFSLLNYVYRYYIVFNGLMEGYDEGTGPNDAKRVVWAPGEFLFLLIGFFSLLTFFKGPYWYFRSWDGLMGGWDEGNGPKRRKTRRLGTRFVFFSIIRFFLFTKLSIQVLYVLYRCRWAIGRLRRGKQAQTAQDASFGHQVCFFLLFGFFSLLNYLYRYLYVF